MNIDLKDITGTFPSEPCIFAACDSKYFLEHASSFCNSAYKVGMPCHIHILNPSKEVFEKCDIYKQKIFTPLTFTFNYMDVLDDLDQMKCIYACLRFFMLPHLLEKVEKVMVLDIDSVVMRGFKFPDKPCGLFVREPVTYLSDWIKEGTRIFAGVVYFDKSYHDKVEKLIEIINSLPMKWYIDQVALNKLFTEHIDSEDLFVFNGNFADFNFFDGTAIWCGKGKSKTDNPRYVAIKQSMAI